MIDENNPLGRSLEHYDTWREQKFLEELEKQCEKCGGESGTKFVGDESYDYCYDCGWITY